MITASGRVRHSVWFSIVDSEWLKVKRRLTDRLAQGKRLPSMHERHGR